MASAAFRVGAQAGDGSSAFMWHRVTVHPCQGTSGVFGFKLTPEAVTPSNDGLPDDSRARLAKAMPLFALLFSHGNQHTSQNAAIRRGCMVAFDLLGCFQILHSATSFVRACICSALCH